MHDPTLTPERWSRVQELFHAVLELPDDERTAYLREAASDDPTLVEEVLSLLSSHEDEGMVARTMPSVLELMPQLREALAGRYEVVREVGSGGMATVFLAEDLKHRRRVAIKVLRPELTATIGADRFLREIEIAARLQHPHILPLYDSGSAGDLLYYVMPFVEGSTLWDRHHRGDRCSVRDATQITLDVLSALEHAHRSGIIHRDIKPANILLSVSGGHAMVADFGIARAVSVAHGQDLTMPGGVLGTPGYMAPEQVSGTEITSATDVYAAGVVAYECYTGRRWRPAGDTADWSGVPGSLVPVLKKALAPAMADRWENAGAFRAAIIDVQGGGGMERRRWPWAALAAVVVALLVGWGVVRFVLPEPESSGAGAQLAVLPFSIRGASDLAYLEEGMVDLLSTKLDGAGVWQSVDPRAVLSAVSRDGGAGVIAPERGARIAASLGADLFVLGSIVEVGGNLAVEASLYDRANVRASLARAAVEGDADDVLQLTDEMAAGLLAAQVESQDVRLTQIAAVTTESLPALKAYLRGMQAFRNAQYPEAEEALQEAVAADSTFALAWYQLSVVADWLLRTDQARLTAERAVQYADRLSRRDQMLLEALLTARRGDADGAERQYREIVSQYPTEVEAWSQLGEIMSHFGPRRGRALEESREAWDLLIRLDPERAFDAYVHLARLEAGQGNLDALDRMAERVIEMAPEGDRVLEMRMLQAFKRDDPAARERVLADLRDAPDETVIEVGWSSSVVLRDPALGVSITRLLTQDTRPADTRALGHAWLASSEAARGRLAEAFAQLDRMAGIDPVAALEHRVMLSLLPALPLDTALLLRLRAEVEAMEIPEDRPVLAPSIWLSAQEGIHPYLRFYLLGLMAASLGDAPVANQYLDSLNALPRLDHVGSLLEDLDLGIQGTLAMAAGRFADAADLLERVRVDIWHQYSVVSPFFSLVHERFLRAYALELAGRLDDAFARYERFVDADLYDTAYLGATHWRRGVILDDRGDADGARSHFEEALRIWDDPGPTHAVAIADIRARMAN